MTALPANVRETISNWLQTGEIEVFIGYEASSLPLQATPAFIRKPDDVQRLIWDATCENNLVAFLKQYRGKKVGLMVKGCDSRTLIGLMREGQIVRENLRIVGVSCPGVVDVKKVALALATTPEDIDGQVNGADITANGEQLALNDVMFDVCLDCQHHNPVVYDLLMGDQVSDPAEEPFQKVHEIEALTAEQRWARFSSELSKCNLCYACRNACPFCYCTVCFVDKTTPRWFSATTEAKDIQFYQMIRTFHLAGRCTGCGACTRACPQGINLRLMLDKLRLDVWELYGDDAGVDPQAKPPLTTYREDDDNSFIL